MNRNEARKNPCPRCGAKAGANCWRISRAGVRYIGKRLHIERHNLVTA